MKKSVANVIYTIIGLILIAIATCMLGTCPWWGNNTADQANPSNTVGQDIDRDLTDTDTGSQTTTDTGTIATGSTTGERIEIKNDVLQDPDGEDYDPNEFEDDEVEELLLMLEEMLDIN